MEAYNDDQTVGGDPSVPTDLLELHLELEELDLTPDEFKEAFEE